MSSTQLRPPGRGSFTCLDLFCGAGGAAEGYSQAGFTLTGVDVVPQPHYPFEFVLGDALTLPIRFLRRFDLVHASPPCPRYSAMTDCRPGEAGLHPDLILAVRNRLTKAGVPYVIENVIEAPLLNPVFLCGRMFGLRLYRHRLFETSWPLRQRAHRIHDMPASKAGHWEPGTVMSVAGNFSPMSVAKKAMGITWMTRDELRDAIPPAYTRWIGGEYVRYCGDH